MLGADGHAAAAVPREAIEHAWNWFALHAGQRMQTFNFFLVATAFLIAGYATVLGKHSGVAVGIALLGAWMSFWFNRMENRTKQLVKAGEAALVPFQQRLAALTDNPSLVILTSVEQAVAGSASYSKVISVMQWTILVAFLGAAAYAGWALIPSLCQRV